MSSLDASLEHRGPPLFAVGLVYLALSLAGLLSFLLGGGPYPSPFDAGSVIWFPQHEPETRLFAFFMLGASVPLGIFAATAISRLRFFGVRAAGVDIAFFGGIAASILTAVGALVVWVLAYAPGVAAHSFHAFAFAVGGLGATIALGIFLAGVSVAAGVARLIPRWITGLGILGAVLCELGSLTLLVKELAILLPVARVLAFIWILAVGAALPRRRRPSEAPASRTAEWLVPETP